MNLEMMCKFHRNS